MPQKINNPKQNVLKELPALEDDETLKLFENMFNDVVTYDMMNEGFRLAKVILALINHSPDFPQRQPQKFELYKKMIVISRWIGLPILKDKEVAEMFEKYLVDALNIKNFDLKEKLRAKLISVILLEDRDKLKQNVCESMTRCQQILGEEKIEMNNEKRDSTISNWIKDFTANMAGNLRDLVKANEYFASSKNFKILSSEDQQKLRAVINVYRWCHLSSLETAGFEEEIPVNYQGKQGVIREGVFEELKPSEEKKVSKLIDNAINIINQAFPIGGHRVLTDQEQKEILKQSYIGPQEERENIHRAEQSIKKASQGDINRIGTILIESINKGEKFQAAACLRLLAQQTDLVKFLQNNERFYNLAKEYIKINYSDTIQSDFERKKFAPPYLSVFLQYLFKNKLKMTSEESARLGIQLEGLIVKKSGKEIQGMVYGDLEKGVYVWHEVKDVGTRLELFKEV